MLFHQRERECALQIAVEWPKRVPALVFSDRTHGIEGFRPVIADLFKEMLFVSCVAYSRNLHGTAQPLDRLTPKLRRANLLCYICPQVMVLRGTEDIRLSATTGRLLVTYESNVRLICPVGIITMGSVQQEGRCDERDRDSGQFVNS